jgi:tetratricopeptide (TPR) repeat protein
VLAGDEGIKERSGPQNSERIASNNYQAWDRLDPDSVQLKVRHDATKVCKVNSGIPTNLHVPSGISNRPDALLALAELENSKGNEALRAKDFDEAVAYYSRSIQLFDNNPQDCPCKYFSNRALAYLKSGASDKSIQDVERTLLCSIIF